MNITLPEIISKGLAVSQEQIALLQHYINQNPNNVASANNLRPFYNILSSGNLTKGRLYEILDSSGGADFTIVGAPDNNVGTQFKANYTNLAPTWGAGSLAVAEWEGATITVTGTTTINTMSKKFLNYGQKIRLIFSGVLILTNSYGTSGDDCELVLGANVTTFIGGEIELQLRNDNKFYAISGTVGGSGGSLWKKDGDFTTLISPQQVRFSRMVQYSQATAIPSANKLTLPANGNYVNISDNTNEIRIIFNFDSADKIIQGGTEYTLDVKAGQKIKHLYSLATGDEKKIRIDAGQDWTASQDMNVRVVYDAEDDWWELQGTAQGDILNAPNILAKKINAPAYEMQTVGELVGWEVGDIAGLPVTNMGTATVEINANGDGVDIGIGTTYGIDIGDGTHFFACNENNVDSFVLIDSVTGGTYFLNGTKTTTTQSQLFEGQQNGITFREDDDNPGTFIQINYSDSKIKTEIG